MPLFALTVFLSAFLLFQIQPIVAKMILPWFGGSSSVWSVCLMFFQLELLLGYAYVHALSRLLAPRRQMAVHGALLVASLLALPVAASASLRDAFSQQPELGVLMVLAGAVGVPYLMLSTTGPLMQAWWGVVHRTGSGAAHTYRLYALSNLASMLGLLTYPFIVEPVWPLDTQAWAWSVGYAVFVLSCAGTAAYAAPRVPKTAAGGSADTTPESAAPGWRQCLLWIALAATPSILLIALTRHLTQDVAPVPFLWVLPLAVYLFSFILCFDAPRYYVRPLFLAALPVMLGVVVFVEVTALGVSAMVALLCLALFVFCMVCHGELVRRKPPVEHLTLFYLMLSIGGAVGGIFVGLLGPMFFLGEYELPIGLFLCAALTAGMLWPSLVRWQRVVVPLAVCAFGAWLAFEEWEALHGYRAVMRNFYGQSRVVDTHYDVAGPVRMMRHGAISHGEQYLGPGMKNQPTAYYCELSGVGQAVRSLQREGPLYMGVVGLGTGTLAAYGREGDRLRLYEINEQVMHLARTEFSFLRDTRATITEALGDGRLLLERDPPQNFDLLVMDAFSGDSIPVHLLTLEALRDDVRHLQPDGMLAVHITNTYLDLRPVMAAAAKDLGLQARLYELSPDDKDVFCRHSSWVLLMRPERAARMPPGLAAGEPLVPKPGFRTWTDGFSNLMGIVK